MIWIVLQSVTGVPKTLEHSAAVSAAKRGIPLSQKQREGIKAAWANPEIRARQSAAISASKKGVPTSQKNKDAIRAVRHSSAYKAQLASQRKLVSDTRKLELRKSMELKWPCVLWPWQKK